ncbi:type II secretion system ATPase GspE [uncultured Desulfuromonas sp.]|uniref:type II secretion system ATPase GspE n=1 Tax=uncultured Desulfuromonas sp. TaxID=181013 RepID=UPI002AAC1382|nr:type II secretion system ATPase GspE [uncultured Desulfuromonas sp.]
MTSITQKMIDSGLFSAAELKKVMPAAHQGEPDYRVAIKTGLVAEDVFLNLSAQELSLELLSELPEDYDPAIFESISLLFMQNHCFFPLQRVDQALHIAVNDPFDYQIVNGLQPLFPTHTIYLHLAREKKIRDWMQRFFAPTETEERSDSDEDEDVTLTYGYDDAEHLKDMASEAPVIKLVNQLLTKAVEDGASDIHIEPFQDQLQFRYRIDGILVIQNQPSVALQQAIVSRIKIMARMDIAERRLPQDGRIRTKIAGKDIDIRVSCLPTMYGESVVMRILDRNRVDLNLETLGFPEKECERFEELITRPYGIVLVTGPTGSGKTTTLYAALQQINTPDKKIITIEDPVEYELTGINQVEVNSKAGLTFAGGLRSIVRQDPDVILIGEIRDKETADIAIQSALTGHLVFSTLHTNDAAGAVTRLVELGVEDYLLSSAVIGIMAQRLVRVLCPECKEAFVPDAQLCRKLELPFTPTTEKPIYRPAGCRHCNDSGYRGRVAIFELMPVSEGIRHSILDSSASSRIRDVALEEGMLLLRQDGWRNVEAGVTSIAEVLRVS